MSQKRLKKLRKIAEMRVVEERPELLPNFWEIIKKSWKFLLVLSFLTIGVYANGMNGDFVSDDYASITQESRIGDFGYMLTKDKSIANSQYLVTYFVYKLFGNTNPFPYHLVSIICLLIFNVVAYVLVRLILKDNLTSKVAMLLFVFLPIHVEAVTWISGRIYIILAIYICLSFINFIYYINNGKYRHLIWSAIFFLLGFLTDKPRPFGVILLIGLYLVFLGWKKIKDKMPTLLKIFGVLVVLCLFIAWPYINNRINIVNSGYNSSESIFYSPFFQYPIAISKYLQLLFFPVDLTLYHTMYVLPGWLNWLILLNYLALVVYFYFKDKRYFFALAFIFVSIFPSMTPVKVSWLVAERYMFLGSLGFCWFMALLLSDHWKKFKIVSPVVLGCFLLWGAVKIYSRNIDWQTNHNLWVNTCQVSPNSHNAWNNIGDDYDKLKDLDNAVKGFSQSVMVKPNYADAYHNRANIFYKGGRFDLARDSYETALKFSPNLYQTYLSLTQIDLMEGKGDLALQHVSKAVELQPNDIQANFVLGVVKVQIGQIDEGRKIFESILSVFPNYTPALNALNELRKAESTKIQ